MVSFCKDIVLDCLEFRLEIDSYMDSYPRWNRKFFPTALRCEKSGFWSYFMSPEGKCYTTFKSEELKIIAERVLLLFVTISCSGVHYI